MMIKHDNGPYTRAIYATLAKINDGTIKDVHTTEEEFARLIEFLNNGRYFYTASALQFAVFKCRQLGFDKEVLAATLLKYMHECNEEKLHRLMREAGWRV